MRRRRRRRRRSLSFTLSRESLTSIAALLSLLFGFLTFISFFAQAAAANLFVQEILNSFFGWGVVFVPVLLTLSGLLLLRTVHWAFLRPHVLFGLFLLFLCFLGLAHFFVPWDSAKEEALMGGGGGLAGLAINVFLRRNFSTLGAFFILLIGGIIALLVTFNTSLDRLLAIGPQLLRLLRQFRAPFFLKREKEAEPSAMIGEEVTVEETDQPTSGEEEGQKSPPPDLEIVPPPSAPVALKTEVVKGEKEPLRGETVVNLPFTDEIWDYPPLTLLSEAVSVEANRGDVAKNAQVIEATLESFGIRAKVVEVNKGPAVTQYALESAQGTKIGKIKSLQNDLAMALASPTGSVRIEAPIPGKSLVGIEVPNFSPSLVTLKSILTSAAMRSAKSKLIVALGHNVAGQPVVADLARMPHVLIAGSTGSGKSTLLHAFLASLLFRCSPSEAKFILVDTKRVELTEYNGIPHLLTPVINDPDKVLSSLKWALAEMERRYKLFQSAKVRDINGYNELSGFQALPFIIIVVDELADLMSLAPVEVEKAICRLAQLARATGIHLVLSTQRPEVRVITGLIKANIPCRIAFNTVTQIDSRVIIDQSGSEKLLGRGDMLYVPPEASKPVRIQGVFVSSAELKRLIEFLKQSRVAPEYKEEVTEFATVKTEELGQPRDDLFEEAVRTVCQYDRASASLLQRRLKIGYARAARLLDDLEERGIVGQADGSKPRDVLIHDPDQVLADRGAGRPG